MARWGNRLTKGAASVQGVGYLNVAASSPRRFKIFDILMGSNASPGDNEFEWVLQRCTTAPTATTVTPTSTDPADTLASTIVVSGTVTVDGTLTAGAFLLELPMNQRASFRWIPAPYFEPVGPATANNGLMLGLSATTTTTFGATCLYEEL